MLSHTECVSNCFQFAEYTKYSLVVGRWQAVNDKLQWTLCFNFRWQLGSAELLLPFSAEVAVAVVSLLAYSLFKLARQECKKGKELDVEGNN